MEEGWKMSFAIASLAVSNYFDSPLSIPSGLGTLFFHNTERGSSSMRGKQVVQGSLSMLGW